MEERVLTKVVTGVDDELALGPVFRSKIEERMASINNKNSQTVIRAE